MGEITVAAKLEKLYEVTEFILKDLKGNQYPESVMNKICIAVDEIFTNIATYAYGSHKGNITVRCKSDSKMIELEFSDLGEPFNPLSITPPDLSLSAYDREVGGLGIHIVKNLLDFVEYHYEDGKNILTIQKEI